MEVSTPKKQRREAAPTASPVTAAPIDAPAAPIAPAPYETRMIGRIPVTEVFPVIEGGDWPAKATTGEPFPVRATVFREGHDLFAATAVLIDPEGNDVQTSLMADVAPGLNRYEAWLCPDRPGAWSFRIEGWSDPYATWIHDAQIKVDAGVDVELMLTEGSSLLTRAATRDIPESAAAVLTNAATILADDALEPAERLAGGTSDEVKATLSEHPLRDMVSPTRTYPLAVDRPLALAGSWYEMFPRSEGSHFDLKKGTWVSGTFATASNRLPAIAEMGFDVVYLTPIHPIGTTNRKGRNNSLTARAGDPGSPYGIGSAEGGHDAIHPELGTFEDFDAFVTRAHELGLEVALDIALQCSPDHPWVTAHPEWFTTRGDGTIAYAENPPKKYQDIYPLNFDNDPEGIYAAIRDMLELWVSHGVTLFRVDNPHTKSLDFWQRLLAEFRQNHPDVVFLAEAFTKPAMMRTLGAIGFHQSYTYFTWRIEKWEIEEYLKEVSTETSHVLRPAFWPTTHDILTPFMQQGGTAAFALRAVLAATGAPTWGIYSGYEFVENMARPGVEEQIDNEKYEFRPRPWERAHETGIPQLLTKLNEARRNHPALRQLHNITIHSTTDEKVLAFSRRVPGRFTESGQDDVVLVVLTLDPFSTHEAMVYLDLGALGGTPGGTLLLHDELSGSQYRWGDEGFVRLDPRVATSHVFAVTPA